MPSNKRTKKTQETENVPSDSSVVEPTPVVEEEKVKKKQKTTKKSVVKAEPAKNEPVEETVKEEVVKEEPENTKESKIKKPKTEEDVKKAKSKKHKTVVKRTPSSYVLFSMEFRKTIDKNEGLGAISKLCGEAWKNLDDDKKKEWVDKALVLRQERQEKINEINKLNPPKKKRKPSSYLLFAMDKRKELILETPDMNISAISKKCGALWKEMDETQKSVWKEKAQTWEPEEVA